MFVQVKNIKELLQIYNTIPDSEDYKGNCESIFFAKYDGKIYVDMDTGEWKFLFRTAPPLEKYLTFEEWKLLKDLSE